MEAKRERSYGSYTSVMTLNKLGDPSNRSYTVDEIRKARRELGFFQLINHGIQLSVMKDALDTATEFFNFPAEEKKHLRSDHVHDPVRYGTSLNRAREKSLLERFRQALLPSHLKLDQPMAFKSFQLQMGNDVQAMQELQKQLMEAVLESLGLNLNCLQEEIEEGSQLTAVNCHPSCPEPELALGMPPHSDYGSLTILLQSWPGLQLTDHNKNWLSVPAVEGALIVQLGDQIEVMSNGQYKSVVHRVTLTKETKRLSIASLHSLRLDKKVGPASKFVDEQHPQSYKRVQFQTVP